MKYISIATLFLILFTQCQTPNQNSQADFETIVTDFKTPTDDNNLWCYWYWIGDDISKEGITKDLEAMKAAGIGAVFIGNVNPDEVDGPVPMLSEDWWSHMVHAVNEGKRLGVDIGSFNCPGWSMSGGPWITYDKAMRHVVYSETTVSGGKKVTLRLAQPKKEFQDLSVLAFPKNPKENKYTEASNTRITVSPSVKSPKRLLDGNTKVSVKFTSKEHTLNIQTKQPIAARSITLHAGDKDIVANCELQALVDGSYKTVKQFKFDRRDMTGQVGPIPYGPLTLSFPETTSNQFRLICKDIQNLRAFDVPVDEPTGFSEIHISAAPVIDKFLGKTLGRMHPTPWPNAQSYVWKAQPELDDSQLAISEAGVFDISDRMDKNGNLNWEAPEGEWTVMRFGMTPTGTKNSPAAPQGKGYEVDKANRKLAHFHFKQFIGEFLKRIPEESKSAFKYVVADSYEMGSQNWTDGFEQKFEKKYGYNPKTFLPVFSGRIVGSVKASNRFLWDLRRAIADDVAYEYVGGLKEIANEHGLKLWLENYGHWGFPSEFLMYGGQSDLIGGEYWNEGTLGDIECKAASSAAHIYGKKTTSAECFTAGQRSFVRHPAMLKKRGDWSLTEGINHHVLHVYIHQPDDKVPGNNAWFSTEFNRKNTWFEQGKTYFDYLRRAQHLLQQGNYAADLCYFIGEDAPIMTGATNPAVPKGYSFDYINAEVIINSMHVKDGRLVLDNGMNYGMMVLPPLETMRPKLLSKLEQLVTDGAIIYGQAPKASPSLQNYPESDARVRFLASKLWAGNEPVKKHGKGAIIDGLPILEALNLFSIRKDVEVSDDVLWTHRALADMDIYFLTNQSGKEININPSFRVEGLQPQLWDALTGEIKELSDYKVTKGRTSIPLKMEADRSWFVIFSNASHPLIKKEIGANTPNYQVTQTIATPWQIDFESKNIAPETIQTKELMDWSKSQDDLLKYYSGTANYTTTFKYQKSNAGKVAIDLGKVGVMATVKLNGKQIGTTWMAPYRLDITDAVKEGDNQLEIKVVNVWRNRLTGDKALPANQRTTSVLVDAVLPEEEMSASGLIGPVTIQVPEQNKTAKTNNSKYSDNRPAPNLRMDAKDHGVVLKYGDGPEQCDKLGARDVWVFEDNGTYYMHYDAAGSTGWLNALATSKDLINWKKEGPILTLGKPGEDDSKAACYGVTYKEGDQWHMFYLGTPNVSPAPDLIPSFPYLTLKAKAKRPEGPWTKQKELVPFRTQANTYYSITASPGQVIKNGDEYLQFISATTEKEGNPCVQRTLGIARTQDLDSPWTVDPTPMVPIEEQIENATLYYEESIKTWFLFTNHIGIDEDTEFTDAIWVYWSNDLNNWNAENKAIVLDGENCSWSKKCIGLPSVVKAGNRLALIYDAPGGNSVSHMKRHIGLAWLELPLSIPVYD